MDSRSDLKNDYPLLANKYNTLRFKAYTDIEVKELVIWEQLLQERREARTRIENCLYQIFLKSGYKRFLLESTVDELQQSSKEDLIVIVNVTDIGCDAIIVLTSEVYAIALPDMNSSYATLFFYKSLERYRAINNR